MDSMSVNNNYNKTDINLVQQQQKEKRFILEKVLTGKMVFIQSNAIWMKKLVI